jgi:heptosyltransferase-2
MAMPLLERLAAGRLAGGRPVRVAVAVRRRWRSLVAHDPRLAYVLTYERSGCHAGWAGAWRLARQWRSVAPRAVVVCPPSFRAALVARLTGRAPRVGYAADGRGLLLSHALPVPHPRGTVHHADELAALADPALAAIGATPPGDAVAWPRLAGLAELAPAAVGDGPACWVLAPGATYGSAKAWPPARAAEFLRLAVRERGVRVVVVGDQADAPTVAAIAALTGDLPWRDALPGPAAVVNLAGRTSLDDLAALLRASDAFLGNDSGVMHVAAALGVPTLGLFGSSSVAWTAPRGPHARALAATGFACQPCFRRTCNQPTFCLDTIGGAAALAALDALVREVPEGSSG